MCSFHEYVCLIKIERPKVFLWNRKKNFLEQKLFEFVFSIGNDKNVIEKLDFLIFLIIKANLSFTKDFYIIFMVNNPLLLQFRVQN